jgi:hypothetical protein
VLTLTHQVYGLDFDGEGRLYVDQFRRPPELVRYPATGGQPERVAGLARGRALQPVELPGGVVLLGKVLGQDRLLLARKGQEPRPLLDERTATRPPVALVGRNRVAFVAGPEKAPWVVLADVEEGVAVNPRRLEGIPADGLTTLAGSHDGERLYYVRNRAVWEVVLPGDKRPEGKPLRLCDGDGVAVHPNNQEVLVQAYEGQGVKLFRVPRGGGEPVRVTVQKGTRSLASEMIGARALDAEGRQALVAVSDPGSWFWGPGLLDLDRGELRPISVSVEADYYPSNWGKDGNVLSIACPLHSDIWRFTPR